MKDKKKILIFIIIILIIILFLGFIFRNKIFTKEAVLSENGSTISVKYPSLSFKYNKSKHTITSDDAIITLNINNDLDSVSSFELIRDYKKMANGGKEKKYSGKDGLYSFNSVDNRYEVIIKIDDKSYMEILIESKNKNNIEKIFNSENIQNILK